MEAFKILIVEDEILIADTIERYLDQRGHEIVGKAISYEEAIELLKSQKPDLALLDIRLSGEKTGIDVAHFMQHLPDPLPYIYLSSQLDNRSIDLAKKTFPAGYLSKPIQKESLYTTIEMAMHKHHSEPKNEDYIRLTEAGNGYNVRIRDISFLQSEHIYTRLHINDERQIMQRSSLKELLDQLPDNRFIQPHRSFAVNIEHISHWDQQNIYVAGIAIPISRSRKKAVFAELTSA